MKIKTTRKYLQGNFENVFMCGYCDLCDIFYGISPTFYNSGVYGWNFDAYTIENIVITTGYRNMIGKKIPHELIKKYSDKAKKIIAKYNWSEYEKQKKALEKNKINFVNELIACK